MKLYKKKYNTRKKKTHKKQNKAKGGGKDDNRKKSNSLEILENELEQMVNDDNHESKISNIVEDIKKNYTKKYNYFIPKNYLKISKRFPHLDLEEIIEFEKKVIKNGGSIMVHKGNYVLTDRAKLSGQRDIHAHETYMSWNCCLHAQQENGGRYGLYYISLRKPFDYTPQKHYMEMHNNAFVSVTNNTREVSTTPLRRGYSYYSEVDWELEKKINKTNFPKTNMDHYKDALNRNPDSECAQPEIFYL